MFSVLLLASGGTYYYTRILGTNGCARPIARSLATTDHEKSICFSTSPEYLPHNPGSAMGDLVALDCKPTSEWAASKESKASHQKATPALADARGGNYMARTPQAYYYNSIALVLVLVSSCLVTHPAAAAAAPHSSSQPNRRNCRSLNRLSTRRPSIYHCGDHHQNQEKEIKKEKISNVV